MKKLKETLDKVITTKPEIIQFAKDRKFEEAWILSIDQDRPSENAISEYLQKEKFEVIIVEYIWHPEDDDKRVVITIFLDKKCLLKDPKIFMHISLDLFYNYPRFYVFIDIINDKIIGKDYLLNTPVDSINIGVFNHWFSVGPVDLWSKGDSYSLKTITVKIKARANVNKSTLNFQGLFFRFNVKGNLDGPYYGIKTPCCTKVQNDWIVDLQKVDYWMKVMLGL